MSRQVSPFAALSGVDKQIRWLEYQSIRLPYVSCESMTENNHTNPVTEQSSAPAAAASQSTFERTQPPPEIPRAMPADYQKTRHSQYDAVIARMKQAELQSRRSQISLQPTQKP